LRKHEAEQQGAAFREKTGCSDFACPAGQKLKYKEETVSEDFEM
jgi:hypothetical protein